ncbi:DUF2158 domain-containing protein [Rhizobium ruizarguesonis]
MSTTQFVKGWVVKLKSGGPLMTVTGHETDEYGEKVYCQWFGDKEQARIFHLRSSHSQH